MQNKKVVFRYGSFQTPVGIKLFRSIPQYIPYNVMFKKGEIIDNVFLEMFDVRFRTCEIGALMEFYDHYDDYIWERRQELIDIRNRDFF